MPEGNRRQALVEQLWERSGEERKETNSEAEYWKLEEKHGKPGGTESGRSGSESGRKHPGGCCEAERGREGKEETEAE